MFYPFVVSILAAFGASVIIVEKHDSFPVKEIVGPIRRAVEKRLPKWVGIFDCTICLSFWVTLATDGVAWAMIDHHYFLWPLSGFIAMGMSWVIYEATK